MVSFTARPATYTVAFFTIFFTFFIPTIVAGPTNETFSDCCASVGSLDMNDVISAHMCQYPPKWPQTEPTVLDPWKRVIGNWVQCFAHGADLQDCCSGAGVFTGKYEICMDFCHGNNPWTINATKWDYTICFDPPKNAKLI